MLALGKNNYEKKNFALERPDNQKEETYVGTLEELARKTEIKTPPVLSKQKELEQINEKMLETPLRSYSENVDVKQQKRSRSLAPMKRKGMAIASPLSPPISSNKNKKKPVVVGANTKGKKTKKRIFIWGIVTTLLIFFYVSTMEIVVTALPQYSKYTVKFYYPLEITREKIPILKQYQKFIFDTYNSITEKPVQKKK